MTTHTKENLKLLAGSVLFALAFTMMIFAIVVENPKVEALKSLHMEEMQVELKLGERKAEEEAQKAALEKTQAELETLRAQRAEIVDQKNEVINSEVTPEVTQVESATPALSFDLDKLAHAVALAETGGCTTGSAVSKNNCFGIMQWDSAGNRSLKAYASHEESFADFKRIWSSFYGEYPTDSNGLALKWTGNAAEASVWLGNVNAAYSK